MTTIEPTYELSSDFHWNPDYDAVLEQVASTDLAHEEWAHLRDMIKFKIQANINAFLDDPEFSKPRAMPPFMYRPATNGGLKLPPVRPRARNPQNPMEPPKSFMTKAETQGMKSSIFEQLHEFESNPPFTIQRLCELCVRPKQHYKSVGKYLRAVEKTLLVTSTWDSFPISPEGESTSTATTGLLFQGTSTSVPTTPIFSPIPFLHNDARTRSRSPPPLALNEVKAEPQALGLVDELDDPRPGHMSDYPTALSSTTTSSSLQDRFVRAQSTEDEEREAKRQKVDDDDDIMVDDGDDKENQG